MIVLCIPLSVFAGLHTPNHSVLTCNISIHFKFSRKYLNLTEISFESILFF